MKIIDIMNLRKGDLLIARCAQTFTLVTEQHNREPYTSHRFNYVKLSVTDCSVVEKESGFKRNYCIAREMSTNRRYYIYEFQRVDLRFDVIRA